MPAVRELQTQINTTQADIDRSDPACEADPFGLLRFTCRHGTAACLARLEPLRRAAAAAVAPGAPRALLGEVAGAAAGRANAEGVLLVQALLDALPAATRTTAVLRMVPIACR
jgi:hypothetical protein